MAYDHEEQEQIASLKAWWDKYGNLVTWLVTAFLLAYASFTGWNYWQRSQAAKAAVLYEELVKAVESNDAAKRTRASADLKDKFSGTAYAQMGALIAARAAFDASDLKAAKGELLWVSENGKNDEFKAIARIRLAGVLLDEKAYDEGLKVLSVDFPDQFVALVADRKGDLYFALNKLEDARASYQTALDKTEVKNPARQLIQLKLDAVGGSPSKG
jgi:predicted negative regulator of RcsB-dependent stress response